MKQLKYSEDHWAMINDPQKSHETYIDMHGSIYNQVKNDMIKRMLGGNLRDKTVLDFGCGGGLFSIYFAKKGAKVIGIDASEQALNAARYYAEKEGVARQCSFYLDSEIPVDEEYDIILAKDIIEHIHDDEGFIKTLSACLKGNGKLLISTQSSWSLNYLLEGSYNYLWEKNPTWCGWDSTHLRFYTPHGLRRIVGKHGLRIREWSSVYIIPYDIFSWLFLLKKKVCINVFQYIDRWF